MIRKVVGGRTQASDCSLSTSSVPVLVSLLSLSGHCCRYRLQGPGDPPTIPAHPPDRRTRGVRRIRAVFPRGGGGTESAVPSSLNRGSGDGR